MPSSLRLPPLKPKKSFVDIEPVKVKKATGTVKADPVALPSLKKAVFNANAPSCMTCKRFSKCSDDQKGFGHHCFRFKPKVAQVSLEDFDEEFQAAIAEKQTKTKERKSGLILPTAAEIITLPKKRIVKSYSDVTSDDFDLEQMLSTITSNFHGIPPDLKIDDRDLPLAKNFVDFVFNPEYLNYTAFPKQVETGINLFTDACHKCSRPGWIADIPVDASLDDILNNIQLLEHGVCPKCKQTRYDMWVKYGAKRYNELAGLAGQRCIIGNSLVLTGNGIMRIDAIQCDAPEDFSTYSGPPIVLENGAVVEPSKFFKQSQQIVRKVKLKSGWHVTGTPEHPLFTSTGFVKTKDLIIGTAIPLYVGQNVWGNRVVRPEREWRPIWRKRVNEYIAAIHKRNTHQVHKLKPNFDKLNEQSYRLLGYWVAEGQGGCINICNQDQQVLDDCESALAHLYGANRVNRNINSVRVNSRLARLHFDLMLDGGLANKSAKKFIPAHVLQAAKPFVQQFMRALFEGDGGFNKDAIEYSTISRRLQSEVSAVLANFGIIHRLTRGKTWATNGTENQVSKRSYHIWIEGPSALARFQSEIGFISERKALRLEKTINEANARVIDMPWWYDKFPQAIKQEFIDLLNRVGASVSAYRTWHKERAYFISRFNYGLYTFFDENHDFWRLQSDNVALSKQRMRKYRAHIEANSVWRMVDAETRKAFHAFYDKYDASDTYWTEVVYNKQCAKKQTVYDFHIPKHHRFVANGILNHNSGKSILVSMLSGYLMHQLLKLPNPVQTYNLTPNTILHGTFTAVTFKQARETLFDPLRDMLKNSKWFKDYHAMLDYHGERFGEELYKFQEVVFEYRHKHLQIYPAGPDKKNLRGRTRIMGGIDELGWFFAKTKDAVRLDPDEIYGAMENSFATLRNEILLLHNAGYYQIPGSLFCNISSPSSSMDKMMRLHAAAKDSKTIYSFKYSTFEMNPRMTEEAFEGKRKTDFAGYKRDILCQPPDSANSFIASRKAVRACIDTSLVNQVRLIQSVGETRSGKMSEGKVRIRQPDQIGDHNRLMALDAGHTYNSFAGVLLHLEEDEENEGKYTPVLDAAFEIIPGEDTPVNFNSVYKNVLCPLIEQFNVVYVAADRWNSVKMLHDIEADYGIAHVMYSVKYQDMLELREDIYAQKIIIPGLETKIKTTFKLAGRASYPQSMIGKPMAHLALQILTVDDNGKKVDKGTGFTDDLFRALALGHAMIIDSEVQEQYMFAETEERGHRDLGVVGSYSGGGGAAVSSNIGAVGSYGGAAIGGTGGSVFTANRR